MSCVSNNSKFECPQLIIEKINNEQLNVTAHRQCMYGKTQILFFVSLTMETATSVEEWEYRDSDCLQPQSRPEADNSQRWRPEAANKVNVVRKQELSV